jgi:uncharacterized short protein YbdD (DUF466 family)
MGVHMTIYKKRCRVCGEWFKPDARAGRFQKVCAQTACQRERKRLTDARWWAENRGYDAARASKKRVWAAAYPNYWQRYRANHPDYVKSNREQTRERLKASRRVFANQVAIRRSPVGYLEDLRSPGMFANQVAMNRSVDGILTFLVQRERFANQTGIDSTPPPVASS